MIRLQKSLLAPRLKNLTMKIGRVMLYELAPNAAEITVTESLDLASFKQWMEAVNVRRCESYLDLYGEDPMNFLNNCDWDKNEEGDWESPEFLGLMGNKRFPSKCWIVLKRN
jgi:hypothetical protein